MKILQTRIKIFTRRKKKVFFFHSTNVLMSNGSLVRERLNLLNATSTLYIRFLKLRAKLWEEGLLIRENLSLIKFPSDKRRTKVYTRTIVAGIIRPNRDFNVAQRYTPWERWFGAQIYRSFNIAFLSRLLRLRNTLGLKIAAFLALPL